MPLLMRRRPLLRAAAVGGGAYYAGKRTAQSRQQATTQDQRLDDLEAQQSEPAAPAPAPSVGITSEAMQKLQELADSLRTDGMLLPVQIACFAIFDYHRL